MDWHQMSILSGGVCTLAIFSFLIKENPFYRIFEHIFIGIASGLGAVMGVRYFLWPEIIKPMVGKDIIVFPDGTYSKPYDPLYLLYLFPLLFGLLYYFIYSKKYGWLAKIVIGFSLGASAGLAFKGFFAEMVPQLSSSFKQLVVFTEGSFDLYGTASNVVFVFTLLAVMYYFLFSFRGEGLAHKAISGSGRWLMMICFGAFFGSTVMARLALLVGADPVSTE
ncbi:MAG: hypothetical protein D6808_01075 [Candidatus Dadabacteria bacterium]|nr:MAG: hypothetical protein D6808_01075 [Candidatus Dadabacteria bacterium]